jgi:tetratricopeptide (TPR) repeat protein
MSKKLRDYCRWNWLNRVKTFLDENPGTIDITSEDGAYLRLAISHNSPEMLETLLAYFVASLPEDTSSQDYASAMHKMIEVFDDYIDFEDLSPEIRNVIHKYLPSLEEKALIEAAEKGELELVIELYTYYPLVIKEVLEAAASQEQDRIIEAIASMAETNKKRAIILRDAGDIYSQLGKFDKSSEFYKKAIEVDPSYYIAKLHHANLIEKHFCTDQTFDLVMAREAEAHYQAVIKQAPKYSCAYKKLGTLYLIWREHDEQHSKELAEKTYNAYVKAIECKVPKLKYDSLYAEIEHLAHEFGDLELAKTSITIKDARLKAIIASIIAHDRDGCSIEDTATIVEEDALYEDDGNMDRDLEHFTLSSLGGIALSGAEVAINDEAP